MTHYSREITMPATRKEGLCNYVQMIINRIEAGDMHEAIMTAVGLLDDLSGSVYADVTTDAAPDTITMSEHLRQMSDAKGAAFGDGFAAGRNAKAAELRKVLGAA
jgi:hypothetical protein